MINYDFVVKKAEREKIDTVTIIREYWQFIWLQKIYERKESSKIYFKGGTAIRFLYGSFRFSEDLDFTSLLSKRENKKITSGSFRQISRTTVEEVELKEQRTLLDSLSFRFLFSTPFASQKFSVRMDFSKREKPFTHEKSVLVPFDYPITPYPLVVHFAKEELLAEKIRALFIRKKPRDLFDLWFLLTKGVKIEEGLIKKKMKIYPKIHFSLEELMKIIKKMEEKKLKQDLNQFLPYQYRYFYKELKDQVLKLLPSGRVLQKD